MPDDTAPDAAETPPTPMRVRLLAGLFALVAVMLIATLVVLVQRSNDRRDAALARKQHSYDVVLVTTEVGASLARAEASLGRFVIDGDRRTGTLYYDEWRHAGALLDQLDALIRDNPAQAARMETLRALYVQRGRELALPATRANYRQGWPALSLFARAGKSDTLPRITRLLREVGDAEVTLLDERATTAAARVDQSNDFVQLLSIVGALLALAALALAWLVVTAMGERRIARAMAESESDRADALDRAVTERTAELREANRRLVAEGATREQAESKLRQVHKMDAVGQLTGGIAHDFNNMLAVVLGGLEMARGRVQEQAREATRHIDQAMEGAERAAALTRRLLSFARAQPLLPAAVEPGRLLRDMTDLIDRTIGERVEVRILSDADVWPVWVDAYQLENAILNLAVNARDAMQGAGTLTMSAANARLTRGEIGALEAGDYVRIAVADNGAGIPPEVIERVFEPFFTTKAAGQGTGLGLSQILGFARQSGGDVALESVVGHGTTVAVFLPRHRRDAVAAPAAVIAAPRAAPALAGTVLVVEDDPRVRATTGAAVEELGYCVLLCGSGREALERLGDNSGVALMMTDVVMPGMTGPELAAIVRALRPDLPILFVTGYVGEEEAESFRGCAVLRKPFTLRALAAALAAAIAPEGAERAA